MTTRYKIKKETFSCALGEEMIILEPEASVYISLNSTASILYKKMVAPSSIEELIEAVTSEFDIDKTTAAEDIKGALIELEKRSLITREL